MANTTTTLTTISTTSTTKLMIWNARGIRHKKDELFDFMLQNNIDICLLSETLLSSNLSIRNNDFYCYRNDRENSRGGGVAILVKKSIRHKLVPIVDTVLIENIGIKLETSDGPVFIYSCYFPGGAAGRDGVKKNNFTADILKLTRSTNENLILGGDFNSRHRSWGCSRANCWGNILHEKIEINNLWIKYPCDPTYLPSNESHQASTLDFYLTNVPFKVSEPVALNDLSSDHLPVIISL